jgi:glycosyltransferase involved in cell wall biosynthesis
MKILYDYQIFFLQKYGGVSTYFANLVKYLNNENVTSNVYAPLYQCKIFQDLNLHEFIKGKKIEEIPRYSTKLIKIFNEFFFEIYSKKNKPDIIHNTYFEKKISFNKIKKIITVYDCTHEKFYNIVNHKKKAIETADHVICISKNTQKDLLEIYGIKENKTSVVYLGSSFSKSVNNINNINLINTEKDSYLLFVGNRFKYKNFINFIKSISLSKILKNNIYIICFGIYPFTKYEEDFFAKENLDVKKIRFIYGDNNTLQYLYNNAMMLVYPSLHEGFGLPILEAMSSGCPVVCSIGSSFNEVGGEAVQYFDPENVYDIKSTIEKVFSSKIIRNEMIAKGLKQSVKFTWEYCANQTLNVYKKVLEH